MLIKYLYLSIVYGQRKNDISKPLDIKSYSFNYYYDYTILIFLYKSYYMVCSSNAFILD